jgi:O-antigen/teichoic acid export membrane protein
VVATLTMLAVVSVLARTLRLSAFGTYGLLVSLTAYLIFVQATVEVAAVKAVAEARTREERERAFSTAIVLYAVAGVLVALVLALGGTALLHLFDIPRGLTNQARGGVLALAVVTAVGWPLKVFQDVLRGSSRFVVSATAEAVAYIALGATLITLALGHAPLWLIVGAGGAAPLLTGLASLVLLALMGPSIRFRRAAVDGTFARELSRLSGYFFVFGIADFLIYSLDRVILAGFRSTAAVGLYEGPIRAHNLVRQLSGTLTIPVLPTTSSYLRDEDVPRQRDLLIRGTRYMLAIIVPIVLVLMVLAKPILIVWLGPKFAAAGTAMSILVGYWLVTGGAPVAAAMLMAAGRVRRLAAYAAAVAASNLVLSLALTPKYGLNGVVLGTTIPYVLLSPYVVFVALSTFSVGLGEFARQVWLPAYSTGALILAGLLSVRLSISLTTLPAVLAVGLAAVLAYWAIYVAVWLRPGERRLIGETARALVLR